jgi:LuxR family maltose regulon positive regulatory protein
VDYFNRGVAFFTLGRAKKAQGDLAGAVLAYEDGLRASLTAGNRILAQVLIVDTGDVQTLQGRLNPAAESFREAIGYKYESSQIEIPYASTASTALANIMRELNDLDSALELLDRGIEIGVANKIVDAIANSYATQVLVHLALGDHTSAKQACDEAARMQREIPDLEPSTVTRTLNSRARCLLAKGEHVEALRYVRESGISIDDEIDYTSEFRQMILARVLIYCGNENSSIKDIKDAHILLRKIIEKTKFAGFVRHQIEALILQALAFHTEGKQDQALSSLSEALELAEPEGYIRIFIDEGTQMQELLGQVEGTDRLMKYVRKLLIAFQTDESEGPKSSSQQLAEPLSKRELEVLRLLQSELTGPEMAQELVISLNTLRTHTKNIYAKLDVTNRRTAVRKAKELDLV